MVDPLVVYSDMCHEKQLELLASSVRELILKVNNIRSEIIQSGSAPLTAVKSEPADICPQCKNVDTLKQSKSVDGEMQCYLCGWPD